MDIAGILHPTHEVQHLEEHGRIRIHRADITQPGALKRLLKKISPETVYHLAGMSNVHDSWKDRKETLEVNFMGTFNLLEACRVLPAFPRVLLVGSADCYGIVPEGEQPITETRPLSPTSPYAVSKIAQEVLGMQYARAEKLPVYLSRSFNHTGPRQKESFVCSAFARQIAMAETETEACEIRVGNLSPRRDFSDVRDVVRAYRDILEKGTPGEPYNVCSGNAVSIQEVLDTLLSHSEKKLRLVVDREKFRPADSPLLLGSAAKLQSQTGWQPLYNIHTTLLDLLDYWRVRVQAQTVPL